MHQIFRIFSAAVLCLCFVFSNVENLSAKSRDPIRIGVSSETSQQIIARITGRALKSAGFNVEFVEFDSAAGLETIATGKVHFDPKFTIAAHQADLAIAIEEERIRSLGGLAKNGRDEPTLKLAWTGMGNKWPYAEKMLKTMVFPTGELDTLAQAVDGGGQTLDQVVEDWMKNNKPVWKRWTAASTNWMKP